MKNARLARALMAVLAAGALVPAAFASPAAAVSDAASCAQVRALDAAAEDGEYEITVFDKTVTVWCADMATAPVEYLSLAHTGGPYNFSQDTYTTTVTTHYTRVRLNLPATASDGFSIDPTDDRFATSDGAPQRWWGYTGSCFNLFVNNANLDLTGTPFAMSTANLMFTGSGNVTASPDGQVIDITGAGGWCGGVLAANPFPLTWLASAPLVTTDPAVQAVGSGDDATFSASATGSPTPTVQWEWSADGATWAPIAGATSSTLTLTGVTTAHDGWVRATFGNTQGSASTAPAALDVAPISPTVSDPADATVTSGGDATFIVTVTGDPRPTVAWETSTDGTVWHTIAGADAPTLTLPAVSTADDGLLVRALASSSAGIDTSAPARLSVDASAPTVTDPADASVTSGDDATFSVSVTGDPAPTVQWQASADGATYVDVPGATGTELVLPDVTTAVAGTTYRATVSNAGGTVTSAPALLAVAPLGPQIVGQPRSVTVTAGDDATFTVTATGDPAVAFRWQTSVDGLAWTDAAGAIGATLTLPKVEASLGGLTVRVVVTNAAGSATSETAVLAVTAAPTEPAPADGLAATGIDLGRMMALVVALVASGAVSLAATRRRRS